MEHVEIYTLSGRNIRFKAVGGGGGGVFFFFFFVIGVPVRDDGFIVCFISICDCFGPPIVPQRGHLGTLYRSVWSSVESLVQLR